MKEWIKLEHGIEPTILDWYNDRYHRRVRMANHRFITDNRLDLIPDAAFFEPPYDYLWIDVWKSHGFDILDSVSFDYSTEDASIKYTETWTVMGNSRGDRIVWVISDGSDGYHHILMGSSKVFDTYLSERI